MEDFRSRLEPPPSAGIGEIKKSLAAGRLIKALSMARRANVAFATLEPALSKAVKEMYWRRRCGEILAAFATFGPLPPFDLVDIVRKCQADGNHHAVVKNCLRLGVQAQFQLELEASIDAIAKHAPLEAEAWRHKLAQSLVREPMDSEHTARADAT